MPKLKSKTTKAKKVAVVKHVQIPADIPVEGVVVIVAKDSEVADTLYEHVTKWLHKAGADIAAAFHSTSKKKGD
jgi:hypothetical protein